MKAVASYAKTHKILSAFVGVVLAWSAIELVVFTAWKNPFANEVVTIRGRFPFYKGFELVFQQSAVGTAKWYRRWCGGVRAEEAVCRSGSELIQAKPVDDRHYELTYYRDGYFSLFAGWEPEVWMYRAYKKGADVEKMGVGWARNNGDLACDGSDEAVAKFENELFCMGATRGEGHKNYKSLSLTEGRPVAQNEQLLNFWLYSELDAIKAMEK